MTTKPFSNPTGNNYNPTGNGYNPTTTPYNIFNKNISSNFNPYEQCDVEYNYSIF
jgi:hypothetical protein